VNMHGVMAEEDGFLKYSTFMRHVMEWTFQRMDGVTRRTGRITKYVQLWDTRGVGLSQANYQFIKLDSEEAKKRQYVYPQLMGASYYCNTPTFAKFAWERIVKPLMPQSVLEKTDLLDPTRRAEDLDKLLKWLTLDELPVFLGGQNHVWPLPESSEPDTTKAMEAAQIGAGLLAAGGTEVEAAEAILRYAKRLAAEEAEEKARGKGGGSSAAAGAAAAAAAGGAVQIR